MDFSSLLNIANTNKSEAQKRGMVRRYDTTGSAAKKIPRNGVQSSAIRAFLLKKEKEENAKTVEACRQKEELLALRAAAKHNRKASAMAKRTKDNNFAANFDHLADEERAKRLEQDLMNEPVGREMSKGEESTRGKPSTKLHVSSRKEPRSHEEEKPRYISPEIRVQKMHERCKLSTKHNIVAEKLGPGCNSDQKHLQSRPTKSAPKRSFQPMDFTDLLKIANQKQHEPINIPVKKVAFTQDRLMTQEEKDRAREEANRKNGLPSYTIPKKADLEKVDSFKKPSADPVKKGTKSKHIGKDLNIQKSVAMDAKPSKIELMNGKLKESVPVLNKGRNDVKTLKKPETKLKPVRPAKPVPVASKPARIVEKPPAKPDAICPKISAELQRPNAIKSKPTAASSIQGPLNRKVAQNQPRPREFPPRDFPPRDFPPREMKRPMKMMRPPFKRRIESDDEDEEMDDFIDDSPIPEEEDYSKHIREIFGYDKRRYIHDDEDDDMLTESSFAQQMKEEAFSARAGLLEDLEDIKREEDELKQKKMKKKKL